MDWSTLKVNEHIISSYYIANCSLTFHTRLDRFHYQGGGLLIEQMKIAVKTKDFTQVDQTIVEKVEPCLYNKGAGKMIHIAHLVLLRNRDRPKHKLVNMFLILYYG